jgi:hypothetical protein
MFQVLAADQHAWLACLHAWRAGPPHAMLSPPRNGQTRGLQIRSRPRTSTVSREFHEPARAQRSVRERAPPRVVQPRDPRPHLNGARRYAPAACPPRAPDPPLRAPDPPLRASDSPRRGSDLPRRAPDPPPPFWQARTKSRDRRRHCAARPTRHPRQALSQMRPDAGLQPESGRRRCVNSAAVRERAVRRGDRPIPVRPAAP